MTTEPEAIPADVRRRVATLSEADFETACCGERRSRRRLPQPCSTNTSTRFADMDGKKKLEELVARVEAWPDQVIHSVSNDRIRSISDAFKVMEMERDALREALTPSAAAKAAYEGEFHMGVTLRVRGQEDYRRVPIPWTTIKDIMSAILGRAIHQKDSRHEG